MPTIPSGFANISIPANHGGSTHISVITFGVEVNTALTAPANVAEAVWDAFDSTMRVALDSGALWGPVRASVNMGAGVVTGDGTSDDLGGAGIDSVPMNCALLVRKTSTQPGRGGRGRYFIPFALEETDVSETGQIDGTTVSDWQTIQTAFLAALVAEDVPMVILHSGAGVPAAVTTLNVQSKIATQRRRLRS